MKKIFLQIAAIVISLQLTAQVNLIDSALIKDFAFNIKYPDGKGVARETMIILIQFESKGEKDTARILTNCDAAFR